jgi:hypothetical protein
VQLAGLLTTYPQVATIRQYVLSQKDHHCRMDFAKEFKLLAKNMDLRLVGEPASWLCRPLEGTRFPVLCFPGTAVPGSGFFHPFRDWFAEKICEFRDLFRRLP